MQAHELRIGNSVKTSKDDYFTEKGITTVKSIDHDSINGYNDGRVSKKTELKYLSGIPITNQRLIDFGFIKSKISEWYHIEDFQIEIVVDEENNFILCVVNGFVLRHLKYIHQLQNLHFELTQKELTLKITK